MSTRKAIQFSSDDYLNITGHILTGLIGGTMLCASFGVPVSLAGGLLGAWITGYHEYKTIRKNRISSKSSNSL